MNWKNILIFSLFVLVLAGLTLGSASAALKAPTKYTIHTYTANYYSSDKYYDSGEYIWESKESHFSNSVIHEKYSGSQTKIQFHIYNNNGNKYHWTDVKNSTLTVDYKIKTSSNKIYYNSKTVTSTNIPKYGMVNTLTLKGPTGSKVLISHIKWTQVYRVWNTESVTKHQITVYDWELYRYNNKYIKITQGKTYVNGYVWGENPSTGKYERAPVYASNVKIAPLSKNVIITKISIRSIGWPSGHYYYNTYTDKSNKWIAPDKYKGLDRFTIYYTLTTPI